MKEIKLKTTKKDITIIFEHPFSWDYVKICRKYGIPWDSKNNYRYVKLKNILLPIDAKTFIDDHIDLFNCYEKNTVDMFEKFFQFEIDQRYVKETNLNIEEIDLSKYGNLFEHQKIGIQFLLARGSAILADEQGLGKMLLPETPVLTPNGWKEIQKLKIGDLIGNSEGTFSKVTGIFNNPKKKFYKFYFNDGTTIESCEEHLWNVKTANQQKRNSNWKTLETKEIIKNIYNKNGKNKPTNIWRFPICKPFKFKKNKLKIDPYILGCLIGDGYLKKNGIILTSNDLEIINYFSNKYNIYQQPSKKNSYDYFIKSKELNNELNNLNLLNKHSWDKFIPEMYKWSSINDRKEIIRGLLDTDGYVNKEGDIIQFTTASYQLANDVKFIIQSLGGLVTWHEKIPTYTYKKEKRKGRLAYTLTLKLPKNFIPFKISRKIKRFKPKTKYQPNRILTKIEYVGKKSGICISTDAPNHLYVIDNFIVTHNTKISSIYSIESKAKKTLIVSPLTARFIWVDELKSLGIKTSEIDVPDKKINKAAKYIILNYDKLKKFKDILLTMKFDLALLDEAHMLKNKTSQRYKAIAKLSPKIKNIVCITGTPLVNRPVDLFPLLKLIKHPLGSNFNEYTKRYCNRTLKTFGTRSFWEISGAQNLHELSEKVKTSMIRRLKKDCLDLPPKIYTIYHIDMPKKMLPEYNNAFDNYVKFCKDTKNQNLDNILLNKHIIQLNLLRQICSNYKMEYVENHIKEALEENEKILIFGWFNKGLYELHEKYKENSLIITGKVRDQQERENIVKEFQTNSKYKIFIGNIKAAGTALTLTAGNNVVFADLSWTPSDHAQSEDRANRIGTTKNTKIFYPIFKDSIEENIYKILENKKILINKILQGTVTQFQDETVVKELIKDFTKKYA